MEGRWERAVVGMVVWVVVAVAIVALWGRIFTLDVWIAQSLAGSVQETATVSRAVTNGAVNVFSNGRDEIWREAMRYMCEHPISFLLGMGSGEIQTHIMDASSWTSTVFTLRNSFVDALVRGGFPFLVCACWVICVCWCGQRCGH